MRMLIIAALALLPTVALADQPAYAERGHSAWGTQHVDNKGPNGENNCSGGGCSQAGGTVRDDGTTNPPPGHAK
jgi:hypothetical protein